MQIWNQLGEPQSQASTQNPRLVPPCFLVADGAARFVRQCSADFPSKRFAMYSHQLQPESSSLQVQVIPEQVYSHSSHLLASPPQPHVGACSEQLTEAELDCFDTVGCIAIDDNGNVAAASSSGAAGEGCTARMPCPSVRGALRVRSRSRVREVSPSPTSSSRSSLHEHNRRLHAQPDRLSPFVSTVPWRGLIILENPWK